MAAQMWENLADASNGLATSEEFETAAYRLVTEQVLYYADRHSKTAYALVDQYERNFRQVLTPLGIDVKVNRQLRYAFAQPQRSKAGTATVAETILVLVLRAMYDESARQGRMNDDGEVVVDVVELDEKHRMLSRRELPAKAKLDALLDSLKRWGVARKSEELAETSDEDTGAAPYGIVIRPAIADLLGDAALAKLASFRIISPVAEAAAQEGSGEGDDQELTP
jgi:hypothetical protein